jgi:hypothetical protein
MEVVQSLSIWMYANCSIAGSIRVYANPIVRDAIRRAAEVFTHPGSGHMDGSRLANIPNVEGSKIAACRYLAIVSGLVWATRMNSASLLSYYPRLRTSLSAKAPEQMLRLQIRCAVPAKAVACTYCICAGCPAGAAILATSG